MESIHFLHANQIFNILFERDLAFTEVRAILDYLLDRQAFSVEVQANEGYYVIEAEDATFEVWVSEMNVVILKEE
jgi:hypothetical protein